MSESVLYCSICVVDLCGCGYFMCMIIVVVCVCCRCVCMCHCVVYECMFAFVCKSSCIYSSMYA